MGILSKVLSQYSAMSTTNVLKAPVWLHVTPNPTATSISFFATSGLKKTSFNAHTIYYVEMTLKPVS